MSVNVNVNCDTHNVFVYGSLLADEVVHTLLKRVPSTTPAILHDYHRFKIKGRVYPAILPIPNNNVTGRVLFGLSGVELHILDEFEDVEYTRTHVQVHLMDKSEKLPVYAYVWSTPDDPNLYAEWDFEGNGVNVMAEKFCNRVVGGRRISRSEEWKQVHMNDFVKMTGGFMQELELPEAKPRVQTYEAFYNEENDKPPQT